MAEIENHLEGAGWEVSAAIRAMRDDKQRDLSTLVHDKDMNETALTEDVLCTVMEMERDGNALKY